MIRATRRLFGALGVFALLAFVTSFSPSASAQSCAALHEVVATTQMATEKPAEASTVDGAVSGLEKPVSGFEVLKDQDVLEFMCTNGASFGVADSGEFVCAASMAGQLVLMVDGGLQINETAYLDDQNVVEFKATQADGKLVMGKLFLVAFSNRERDDSNVHLVFQLSDPDGYGGVRYIFDSLTSAISCPRCICAGVGTGGALCGVIDCDEGNPCGDPAHPRGCRWDIPQGPRIKPIDGGSVGVER